MHAQYLTSNSLSQMGHRLIFLGIDDPIRTKRLRAPLPQHAFLCHNLLSVQTDGVFTTKILKLGQTTLQRKTATM